MICYLISSRISLLDSVLFSLNFVSSNIWSWEWAWILWFWNFLPFNFVVQGLQWRNWILLVRFSRFGKRSKKRMQMFMKWFKVEKVVRLFFEFQFSVFLLICLEISWSSFSRSCSLKKRENRRKFREGFFLLFGTFPASSIIISFPVQLLSIYRLSHGRIVEVKKEWVSFSVQKGSIRSSKSKRTERMAFPE